MNDLFMTLWNTYARYCEAVPHPWDEGVWQLQCYNASMAGAAVGQLTEVRVWWNS